jgi:hypothetical protein
MADAGSDELRERYRDLTEIDRRPEGIRYSASLPDGTPVVVTAIAGEVVARVRYPERFLAALERAATVQHEALASPLVWGQATSGLLHCAYARLAPDELTPGSIRPDDVAAMGVQLSHALTIAHSAGLAHGAITRDRVSWSQKHGVKLNEFGLFAALNGGGLGVQDAAALLSDAVYVSPEELSGVEPDEYSDIYSLGASLYELLTGKAPYGGRTTSYVLATVLPNSAEYSSEHLRTTLVVDALVRAIERAPDDRWPSAAAFANALSARTADQQTSASGSRVRGCFSKAAAVIVMLASAAAFFVRR